MLHAMEHNQVADSLNDLLDGRHRSIRQQVENLAIVAPLGSEHCPGSWRGNVSAGC